MKLARYIIATPIYAIAIVLTVIALFVEGEQ